MENQLVSAVGCFVLIRGFRMVAAGNKGSDTEASINVAEAAREPLAGIGATVFLLAFLSSKALMMIQAFRY